MFVGGFLSLIGAALVVGSVVFTVVVMRDGAGVIMLGMIPMLVAGVVFLMVGVVHTRGTIIAIWGRPSTGSFWERWFEQLSLRQYSIEPRDRIKRGGSNEQ